jgi:hypothetical protein
MVTSPLLTLGRPNLPATKKETETPVTGTGKVRLLVKDPVVFLRNTTAPPSASDLPVILTLTIDEVAPAGLVTRIRQGDGAHEMNRALGFVLLLICNSTFIVITSHFWRIVKPL